MDDEKVFEDQKSGNAEVPNPDIESGQDASRKTGEDPLVQYRNRMREQRAKRYGVDGRMKDQ